ncbi:MAG: hypothetical protein AAGC85_20770 [Bacteroidota bacterium]
MMRYSLLLISISILTSSCATILNSKYKKVTVYTPEPTNIIYEDDTIKTVQNKVRIYTSRQKGPLVFQTQIGSAQTEFRISSKVSPAYFGTIFYMWPLAFFDSKSPKIYTYPSRLYLGQDDVQSKVYLKRENSQKGDLRLHLSLPYLNNFVVKPENESPKINTGFWGLSVGLDYHYSQKQFLSAGVSGTADIFFPVIAALSLLGEQEFLTSGIVSLSHNHKVGRFSFGYGLTCGRYNWRLQSLGTIASSAPPVDIQKSHLALGLIIPIYYEHRHWFQIGLVYKPSFYRPFISPGYAYEHVISVDIAFKPRLLGK